MSIENSWISVSVNSCRDPCPWFDWIISNIFFVERLPPPFSFFLFAFLSLELKRKNRNSTHWISSGWLGLSQDPSGPWLPDVLVHWCQQLDLSLGFVRVCLGGQTAWKSLQSGMLSPHQGLPLMLYFPLFITVSRLLIRVSVDCTYPMVPYLMPHVWPEIYLS